MGCAEYLEFGVSGENPKGKSHPLIPGFPPSNWPGMPWKCPQKTQSELLTGGKLGARPLMFYHHTQPLPWKYTQSSTFPGFCSSVPRLVPMASSPKVMWSIPIFECCSNQSPHGKMHPILPSQHSPPWSSLKSAMPCRDSKTPMPSPFNHLCCLRDCLHIFQRAGEVQWDNSHTDGNTIPLT